MTTPAHFIAGQWTQGQGHPISSTDPAKKTQIWQALSASADQVNQAVDAARAAFIDWSDRDFDARLAIVKRFAELLTEHKQQLAATIASETGKTPLGNGNGSRRNDWQNCHL